MFAKLYGRDTDQVLVKLDMGEDANPEIRVYCVPEGLGVCSVALQWNDDTEESWNEAENVFREMTEKKARGMAEAVCRQMGTSLPNDQVEFQEGSEAE